MPRDGPSGSLLPSTVRRTRLLDAPVDHRARQADRGVEQEHALHERKRRRTRPSHDDIGQRRQQRARGAHQRAGKAVAHEEGRAVPVAHRLGEQGLLERQEDADVAGRGIDGSDKGDEQQGPEGLQARETQARRDHQSGGGQQRPAMAEAAGDQAGKQREARRPQQGRGGENADLERIETEREKIGGQQDAHIAVGYRPQCPRTDQPFGIGIGRCRKQAHRTPIARTGDSNRAR